LVNATDILSLIEHHKNLSLNDVKELDNNLNKTPWFSTLHFLQTKAHKNSQSTLFEGLLRKAAIYSGDRNVLYDFINDQFKNKLESESAVSEAVIDEQLLSEDTISTKEAAVFQDNIQPIVSKTINLDVSNEIEMQDIQKEVKPVESEANNKEPVKAKITIDRNVGTENSIIQEITEDEEEPEIDLNKDIDTRIKVIYNPSVELTPLANHKKTEENIPERLPLVIAYNPEKELAKYIEPIEKNQEGEDHDFTFWLDHFNEEEEVKINKKDPKNSSLNLEDGDPTELLEKFIQNRPSISRPKAEFFNAENMSRKSEELKLDLVSESLAKLFLKQGMPDKALEIYEKLMLQNPSNNALFAAQIEKIKKIK
jgi:hypothetical protein